MAENKIFSRKDNSMKIFSTFQRVAHMRSIKKVSENSSPNDTFMERKSAIFPRKGEKWFCYDSKCAMRQKIEMKILNYG